MESKKKPPQHREQKAVTFVRSSEEWKTWLEATAKLDRCSSISELIDRALVEYARSRRYDPPPRR